MYVFSDYLTGSHLSNNDDKLNLVSTAPVEKEVILKINKSL
jgi:hypothetical protein